MKGGEKKGRTEKGPWMIFFCRRPEI